MKSKIVLSEKIKNKDRLFGSSLEYYPALIEDNGTIPALFTKAEIDRAIIRAKRNPEDTVQKKTFWERVFK